MVVATATARLQSRFSVPCCRAPGRNERPAPRHVCFFLLFDADADSPARSLASKHSCAEQSPTEVPRGVIIGYPGNERIVAGVARFARAIITVHGAWLSDSGSTKQRGANAIACATEPAAHLSAVNVAQEISEGFHFHHKLR